jgi:uncharacterized damage-inducible protein DinB
MNPQVAPLAAIYDLNTDLLLNCLEGLTDAEARRRLEAGGNSVTFLAAHLADSRHFLLARLNHPLNNPLARYLADVQRIEDILEWPTLEEIRTAWLAAGAQLTSVLAELTSDELAEANVHRFPLTDNSRLGMVAFLVQHESYHLGQIGFLRRQLGKPPMSYARGDNRAARSVSAPV